MASSSDSFVASLARFRWFHAIGQPLQEDGVVRLGSFSEWPGPEDPRVEALFIEHQSFKDELELSFKGTHSELAALWDVIHRRVLETAGPVIGYDEAEDAWHGPTTATEQAAWIAGLVAWYQSVDHPIPDSIKQQWAWFSRGRWPAGFAMLDERGKGKGFLVL